MSASFLPERALTPFEPQVNAVALIEIAIFLAGILLSLWFRRSFPAEWLALSATALGAVVMMLPISAWVWETLPLAKAVQFSWRWLFVLSVPMAFFAAAALARSDRQKYLSYVACAVVLLSSGTAVIAQRRFGTIPRREIAAAEAGQGIRGVGGGDYLPAGLNPHLVDELGKSNFPRVAATPYRTSRSNPPAPAVRVLQWGSEAKDIQVSAPAPSQVELRLFDYPAWRTEVNGRPAATMPSADTRVLLLSVAAGESTISVRFARTWDRWLGGCLSAISFSLFLLLALRQNLKFRSSCAQTAGSSD